MKTIQLPIATLCNRCPTPEAKLDALRNATKNLDNPDQEKIRLHLITQLQHMNAESISTLLAELSPMISECDLSSNVLGYLQTDRIQLALSGLHHSPQVTTLFLNNNRLGTFDRPHPENTFSNLSPALSTLDISSNEYWCRGADWIQQLLSGLKQTSVKKLIMRHNNLGRLNFQDLINTFKDISVSELDLSHNDFKFNVQQLITFFEALSHLDCIHFSGNGLGKLPETQQKILIKYLKEKNNILIDEEPYHSEIMKMKKLNLAGSIDRFFSNSNKEIAYFAEPHVIGMISKLMSV